MKEGEVEYIFGFRVRPVSDLNVSKLGQKVSGHYP